MQGTKVIRIVKYVDKTAWADFVYNHKDGNIFHTPEMFEVLSHTKNYQPIFVAALNDNSEISGLLIAVIQKEYSGILGQFTARSIIWGGPLISNNCSDTLNSILTYYNNMVKKKAIYSQYRNFWEQDYEKEIFLNNGYFFDDHLDIIHDLTLSKEKMLSNMHQGRRKNIRKAIKRNVVFEEITEQFEMENALSIIRNTYKKVKLPFPDISFFQNSFNVFYKKGYLKLFAAKFNDIIIGTRFVFTYKENIYDWFAGSVYEYLDKYPNDFLPWEIMQWGNNNNFKSFDFGGAGKPGIPYGVRDYKLKFGGNLVNYGRYEKVHKPFLMRLGKLGLKIKQRLF